jgi:predicted RNA-binding Zn-ribbon protein involved in translation (DUF1610 family)
MSDFRIAEHTSHCPTCDGEVSGTYWNYRTERFECPRCGDGVK